MVGNCNYFSHERRKVAKKLNDKTNENIQPHENWT